MSDKISVIITTSNNRNQNLENCLIALTLQYFQDFEVIVVDDGSSSDMKKVIEKFVDKLNIYYIWRDNDKCPGRSRNMGADFSSYDSLVFLDSDILLNKTALYHYNRLFTIYKDKKVSFWGKYGSFSENIPYNLSLSDIIPEIKVVKEDIRWTQMDDESRNFRPFKYCWSGNFGLSKNIFNQVNGFNEKFIGWGLEDCEFAFRLELERVEIIFVEEVWGENQPHPMDEDFRNPDLFAANRILLNELFKEKGDFYNKFKGYD